MSERDYLLLSATASGSGLHPTGADGIGQPRILSGYGYRQGMVFWSGIGTASGTLFGSPDPGMGWFPISGFAWNNAVPRNSAIISANYGHLMATLTFTANSTGHLFVHWASH